MAELAIIIVTWNVREMVLEALRSLYADLDEHGPQAEVYVVDSASSDGTPEALTRAFPQIRLIVSKKNLGFAGGNNRALREIGFIDNSVSASSERHDNADLPRAIYLLNPDTITQLGATRTLYDALMADPHVGLVGAQLAYGDGRFQHSAFHFPGLKQLWVEFFPTPGRLMKSSFNGRYPLTLYQAGKPFAIDFPLGATYMLKREVIEQTGMFDEQFFMYCEEIDWAWRVRNAGWQAQCVPAARVIHLGGQSTGQMRPRSVVDLWTSRLRLYHKHYPVWKMLIACLMVAAGMWLRVGKIQEKAITDNDALAAAYHRIQKLALGG